MLALGIFAALGGGLLIVIGRRLAGYLTSQPMHREGDALFMYMIGLGYLSLSLGTLLLLAALTTYIT